MDNREAKLLLGACRPNGQDAVDPAMREALEQAEHDPALKAWLNREQAVDAALARKLKEVRPPANLKAEILAGAKIVRPAAWWQQPGLLAVAAVIVILLTAGILLMQQPVLPAPMMVKFRQDVSGAVAARVEPDQEVRSTEEAQAWLANQNAPVFGSLPEFMKDPSGYACKVLAWEGTKASMVSFQTPRGVVHLFVVDLSVMPGQKTNWRGPEESVNSRSTLAWTDDKLGYVLVADDPGLHLGPRG